MTGLEDFYKGGGSFAAEIETLSTEVDQKTLPMVGMEIKFPALTVPSATFLNKDGSLLSREAYAALYAWAASITDLMVTEAEWLALETADPNGAVSRYSSGDGISSFRIPTVGTLTESYAESFIYSGNEAPTLPTPEPQWLAQQGVNGSEIQALTTRIAELESQERQLQPLRFESINPNGGSTSYYQMVAKGKDGRVYWWGTQNENPFGNTDDKIGFSEIPIPEDLEVNPVKQYFVNGSAGFILMESGQVYCWGENSRATLGTGNVLDAHTLTKNTLLTNVDEIFPPQAAGHIYYRNFFAKLKDGTWVGWGDNDEFGGRFGNGNTTRLVSTPQALGLMPDGGDIARIWNFGSINGASYALSSNDNLYVCGSNNYGALGLGNTTSTGTWTEVLVIDGSQLKEIHSNYAHYTTSGTRYSYSSTLFLMDNGDVYSCGFGGYGALGHGNTTQLTTPTLITGLPEPIETLVTSGNGATSCWASNGIDKVWAWGYNGVYQLGTGNTTQQTLPYLHNIDHKKLHYNQCSYQRDHINRIILEKDNGEFWGMGSNNYGCLMYNETNSNTWTGVGFKRMALTSKNVKQIYMNATTNGDTPQIYTLMNDGTLYGSGYNGTSFIKGIYDDAIVNDTRWPRRML